MLEHSIKLLVALTTIYLTLFALIDFSLYRDKNKVLLVYGTPIVVLIILISKMG